MELYLSEVIISGHRLEKLVNFLFKISDRVDLVSTDCKEMTKQEYEKATHEGALLRMEMDLANGLTAEEIAEINYDLAEEELDLNGLSEDERQVELENQQKLREYLQEEKRIRESSFIKHMDIIPSIIDDKFKGLNCQQRKVTCTTHCTSGPPSVIYSFSVNEKLKEYFLNMELLTWPLKNIDGSFLADDPAFYLNGSKVCTICSHESYVTLYLSSEEAEEFYSLGIPFLFGKFEEEPPVFPHLRETVCVIPMSGTITTLLGLGIYDCNVNTFEQYEKFYQWFNSNLDRLRKEIRPLKQTAREIIDLLHNKYILEPYHSDAIEQQCQRQGWDYFYTNSFNDIISNQNFYIRNQSGIWNYTHPVLEPFLYHINYDGEWLLIGGEFNNNYIFADIPEIEETYTSLIKNIDPKIYGISGRGTMTESLFGLLKEINILRGINEYEKYKYNHFRTYLQILMYEEYINEKM